MPVALLGVVACALAALAALPGPAHRPIAAAPAATASLAGATSHDVALHRPVVRSPQPKARARRPRPAARPPLRFGRVRGGYACPLTGPIRVTDRWHGGGLEVAGRYDAPLLAVTAGTVRTGPGWISVLGDDGTAYAYTRTGRSLVRSGSRVRAGQLIGAAGAGGIRFERRPHGGTPVDPFAFLVRVCS